MLSNLKKSVCSLCLIVIMLFTMVPANIFASSKEDLVSKEKLTEVVTNEVDSVSFKSFGADIVINAINNIVRAKVTKEVNKALTPESMKKLLKEVIKEEIRNNPDKYDIPEYINIDIVVDQVIDGRIVDMFITNKLSQKIIDRTIEYSIEDIMKEIRIPTTEEVMAASRDKLIEKEVEEIYNSDKKEDVYYKYKLELQGFKIVKVLTGWDEGAISKKITFDAASVVLENCKLPDLEEVDFEGIVKEAAKRAAKEVVIEELTNSGNIIIKCIKDVINKGNK